MIRNHIIYNPVAAEWRMQITKATESFLWNEKGQKLIDFTSGWNVANLGWNHPEVNKAVIKQTNKNVYVPMETSDPIQEEYAYELSKSLPKSLNAFGRATGGTEANEMALKIARASTGRKKFIGFRDTYHGQSFGVMSIGYRPEYVTAISPMLPDFIQMDYPAIYISNKSEKEILNDFLEKLEILLKKKDIAAIITEAGIITGWGSTYVAPYGYLKSIRKLTKQYGTLMILDEVGTGFSRCGKLFGMELENVVPDIATFAKGASNGAAAIGTVATNKDIVDPVLTKTNLTSTFGWTNIACAAALQTLKIHKREKIWEQSEEKGNWLKQKLTKVLINHPKLGDIRGFGMEIGVVFVKDKKTKEADWEFCKRIVKETEKNGLFIVYGDEGSIQLMPPLTTPKKVLQEGLDIFIKTVSNLSTF